MTMTRKRPNCNKVQEVQDKKIKVGQIPDNDNKTTEKCHRNLRKRPVKSSAAKTMGEKNHVLVDHKQIQLPKERDSKFQIKNKVDKRDLFTSILESIIHSDRHLSNIQRCCNPSLKDYSIVSNLFNRGLGFQSLEQMKQACSDSVVSLAKKYKLYRRASPFDRRCTVLEWHPTNPSLLAAGSKGGDIILWNIESVNKDLFIEGRGPGGSVSAMKFHPHDPTKVYTSALDGKVSLQDFNGRHSQVLLDTMTWDYWYTSMDIQSMENLMVAGESTGKITLMSMEGNQSWTKKLHKSKITHAEFSKREPWLLCTASTDKTCKLWDVRMVADKKSSLHTLEHNRPINSAYFSLTDGTRLLTTDQQNEIRIYSSPDWHLEKKIIHPHRFFQHITPIKAQWHPLEDIIVIGRYPDDNCPGSSKSEPRTVDLLCSQTGKVLCQLSDSSAPGIVSLNKFSNLGERLASSMGVNILVWEQQEYLEQKQEKIISEMMDIGVNPGPVKRDSRSRSGATSSNGTTTKQNTKQDKKNVQQKLQATKTKIKTKTV